MRTRHLAFLFVIVFSCGKNAESPPENLLDEERYIEFIAEGQLLTAYQTTYLDSVKTDSLRKELYKKFNITPARLDSSHNWYRKDVLKQKKRLEKAGKILEAEMEKLQVEAERKHQELLAKKDSVGKT